MPTDATDGGPDGPAGVRFPSVLTPFPRRGSRPGAVGTVRTPSGRREARRGRTDPFKVSPGPSSSVEGGHQRKKATIWPSSSIFGALSDGGRQPAMATLSRQTMAPVGPLTLPRWHTRAIICSNGPTASFEMAPKPSRAKRSQHLGIGAEPSPSGGGRLSEPKKCARGAAKHRADRSDHSDHADGRLALRCVAS